MTKREMIRYNGRDIDVMRLALAADAALRALDDMTTDQFSKGEDRQIRRDLATALGLDPSDHSL